MGPGLPYHMVAGCKGKHPEGGERERERGRGGEGRGGERGKGEGEGRGESGIRCISFNDLPSEFTLHHFYYILSIRHESRQLAHIKGREIRLYLLMGGVENNPSPA